VPTVIVLAQRFEERAGSPSGSFRERRRSPLRLHNPPRRSSRLTSLVDPADIGFPIYRKGPGHNFIMLGIDFADGSEPSVGIDSLEPAGFTLNRPQIIVISGA